MQKLGFLQKALDLDFFDKKAKGKIFITFTSDIILWWNFRYSCIYFVPIYSLNFISVSRNFSF